MLKKVALLISFVMILSLSFVFATEGTQDTLLTDSAASGEVTDNVNIPESGETNESGETIEIDFI